MERVDHERRLVRPLLGIPRADLRQACQDQGIEYWDDPHNSDRSFTRVRIRTLMENMESELGPGLPAALSRTAEIASESEEFLTAEARKVMEKARGKGSARSISYEVSALAEAHPAVRNKALFLIAQSVGAKDISRAQVLGVEELISNWHGQKMVQLSGITVERVGDQLVFKSTKSLTPGAC
jgi:tRNA(Ile)-lysidine synthase